MEKRSPTSPLRAAIYARISRDRAGAGLGVERQEADCRDLAERLGWEVAAVYVDNDISAYSGAPRPQYRAMLDAVRAGEVHGVLAWHTDRLHRRATELEEFVTVAEAHSLQVQTVTAGTVDLTTASGRMVARMLGAAAQHEVDHARERMQRAKDQMAADGKYRGGQRPYGYERDGRTIRESEAEVIREATTAILAGRSLAAVARDLNERGLKTAPGTAWTYSRLKDVLIRPRNAGLLAHGDPSRPEGDKYRRTFEIVGLGTWPAIIPEGTWRGVVAVLTDPSRRHQNGNDTRWLGSGIYTCGIPTGEVDSDGEPVVCGSPLRPAPYGGTGKSRHTSRKYLYRCVAAAHLTVSTTQTDEYVRSVVADLVRDPRVIAGMVPADTHLTADRERRTSLGARLDGFERDYALGRITGAQLQKATAAVTAELADVDARLAQALRHSASSPILRATDPGQAFLDAPIDVQRAVLATVLRVQIQKAPKKGAQWTKDRVKLSPVA